MQKKIINWCLKFFLYYHLSFLIIVKLIEEIFGILINIDFIKKIKVIGACNKRVIVCESFDV